MGAKKLENTIEKKYFNWLRNAVFPNTTYLSLMRYLFNKPFVWVIERDSNREADGLSLRYRFCYEHEENQDNLTAGLGNRPCSVLEMMAAICIRFEETVMSDPEKGDRTRLWFWDMLKSLGLSYMQNDCFDIREADEIINRFLNRQYLQDGTGGLFTIRGCKEDLRDIEIWCQATWHFNEVLENDRRTC